MRNFLLNKYFLAAISVIMLAACAGQNNSGGGSSDEFVIGIAAPFTGDSSQFGSQIKMGVELFAEQINGNGGINGRKIKLNYQDDAGKADQAQTVATALAGDPSVLAVIGHFNSSCSLAGKGIYSAAKMVMLTPASTNVEVTKGSEYIFRDIFTDDFQGRSLADYSSKVLGKKNAAIMFDNDDYGTGLKDSYEKQAKALGLNVVTELAYDKNAPDFRSQLTTIQGLQTKPDILLIAGLYTQAANIARQARALGMEAQFIGGDGVFSQQFITLGGEPVDGTFVSCPFLFDLGGKKANDFAEAFRKKFNAEPDAWAALSYDAISMVCDGLKKNGFTRKAVLDYLQTIDSPETAYSGVVGDTYFDKQGDCKRPVQIAQVKNGKFVAAEKQLKPKAAATVAAPSPSAKHSAPVKNQKTTAPATTAPGTETSYEGAK